MGDSKSRDSKWGSQMKRPQMRAQGKFPKGERKGENSKGKGGKGSEKVEGADEKEGINCTSQSAGVIDGYR